MVMWIMILNGQINTLATMNQVDLIQSFQIIDLGLVGYIFLHPPVETVFC